MTIPGMKCPKCGSHKIWKYGFVPTKAGKKIRYKCTDCASSFYTPAKVKAEVKSVKRRKSGKSKVGGRKKAK
jgi:transposase-like protein